MVHRNKPGWPRKMAITAAFTVVAITAIEETPYVFKTMAREINDKTPGGLSGFQMLVHSLTDPFEDDETLYEIEYGPNATLLKRTPIKTVNNSPLTRMIRDDLRARPDRLEALGDAARAGGAHPIMVDIYRFLLYEKIEKAMTDTREEIKPIIERTEASRRETEELIRRRKELEHQLGR